MISNIALYHVVCLKPYLHYSDYDSFMPSVISAVKAAGKKLIVEEWGSLYGSGRTSNLQSNIQKINSYKVRMRFYVSHHPILLAPPIPPSAVCAFLRIVIPLFFLGGDGWCIYARGLAHRSFIWLCSVHVQVPWLYWELITNGDPHQGEDYEVSGLSPLLIL